LPTERGKIGGADLTAFGWQISLRNAIPDLMYIC
jgi:hypothetical protein